MVEVGSTILRKEFVDSQVKQIAERMYKFKQAVSILATNAEKNFFYRETPTPLTGQSGNSIKGIPRGAAFPSATPNWTKVSATLEKYGAEDFIFWEDILTDDIDVMTRVSFKLAEGVTKAVDDEIWAVLSESQAASLINSVSSGVSWESGSATIIDDLMHAKQKIAENNYPTENLLLFVSPKDHRNIVKYLTDKGSGGR